MSLLSLLLLLLAACGGGGGTSSSSDQVIIAGTTASSGTIVIAKSALQLSESTTVSVTLKNPDGTPAAGIPVNFTTTLGTLNPSNGIVNTDTTGTATIGLTAGQNSGQGQIIATATVATRAINLSTLFTVVLPPLTLANITLTGNATDAIDFGSTQGVSVEIRDANNNLFTSQSVDVVFTSTQVAQGKATISSPVPSREGLASTTYTAVTATGTDVITASIPGSSITKTLVVNPLNAGSITFVSAAPLSIGLKGMGGAGIQETSRVTFRVLDTSGAPRANQPVNFALNTTVGGLALSNATGSTAADGTVSTIVQAGIVATPVRVTASTTVNGNTLSTQSDQLTVSTGVPSQDGFSVAVSDMNPEAFNTDGVAVSVTARLSDHFHNPVPDGTAVSFTTSGGSITPSCATVGGVCSVTWRSQNPRPREATGALLDGRAVVLAYAVGEEFFLDLNGNGLADPSDTIVNDSEAYRDDNESGTKQTSETFIDFNGNGAFDPADTSYNGVLQGPAFVGAPKSKHVFSNNTIVMSTSSADITAPSSITGPGNFTITVRDRNGNTMPSGTSITITAPFGTASGAISHVVPQNIGFGVTLPFNIAAGATPRAQSGLVTVTVTSPAGLITQAFIPISGSF